MAVPRYADRVSMTGFHGYDKETDTVYFGGFELIIGRSYAGIASYMTLFAPDGKIVTQGYRTGMGKFTFQDWRSGYKYHHSFGLWMSIFSYFLALIDVWEHRYGQQSTE